MLLYGRYLYVLSFFRETAKSLWKVVTWGVTRTDRSMQRHLGRGVAKMSPMLDHLTAGSILVLVVEVRYLWSDIPERNLNSSALRRSRCTMMDNSFYCKRHSQCEKGIFIEHAKEKRNAHPIAAFEKISRWPRDHVRMQGPSWQCDILLLQDAALFVECDVLKLIQSSSNLLGTMRSIKKVKCSLLCV